MDNYFNCKGKNYRYLWFVYMGCILGLLFSSCVSSDTNYCFPTLSWTGSGGVFSGKTFEWADNNTYGNINITEVVVLTGVVWSAGGDNDVNQTWLYVNGTGIGKPTYHSETSYYYGSYSHHYLHWYCNVTVVDSPILFELYLGKVKSWVTTFYTGSYVDVDCDGDYRYYNNVGNVTNGIMNTNTSSGNYELYYYMNYTYNDENYTYTYCHLNIEISDIQTGVILDVYPLNYTDTITSENYVSCNILIEGISFVFDDDSFVDCIVEGRANFSQGWNNVTLYSWGGSDLHGEVNGITVYWKMYYYYYFECNWLLEIKLVRTNNPITDGLTYEQKIYYEFLFESELYVEFYNREVAHEYNIGDNFLVVYNLSAYDNNSDNGYYIELYLDNFIVHTFFKGMGSLDVISGIDEISYMIRSAGSYHMKVYRFNWDTKLKSTCVYNSSSLYIYPYGASGADIEYTMWDYIFGIVIVIVCIVFGVGIGGKAKNDKVGVFTFGSFVLIGVVLSYVMHFFDGWITFLFALFLIAGIVLTLIKMR